MTHYSNENRITEPKTNLMLSTVILSKTPCRWVGKNDTSSQVDKSERPIVTCFFVSIFIMSGTAKNSRKEWYIYGYKHL
jgi:hypothetical protein